MSRAKRWCFTLNNYTDDDVQRISRLDNTVEYLVCGRETGDSGTPHLQGFVILKTKDRLGPLKRLLGERVHAEVARGTNEQASEYCKKDGNFFELGDLPGGQGTRSDLLAVCNEVKQGVPLKTIAENHPEQFVKFHRGIAALKLQLSDPYNHTSERGIWIYGSPGVGKSRAVREVFPDAYIKQQNKWWDGYQDNQTVLLDDLDTGALSHYMKLWFDRYHTTGETKGGTTYLSYHRFVVTTNYTPEELFKRKSDEGNNEPDHMCIAAVRRRCTMIYMTEMRPNLIPNREDWDYIMTYEQTREWLVNH